MQIGWITVFLCEYAGPLFVYLWFYRRPWLAYGEVPAESSEQVSFCYKDSFGMLNISQVLKL